MPLGSRSLLSAGTPTTQAGHSAPEESSVRVSPWAGAERRIAPGRWRAEPRWVLAGAGVPRGAAGPPQWPDIRFPGRRVGIRLAARRKRCGAARLAASRNRDGEQRIRHPQTRSLVPVHSGIPPGFVVWKAAAPPGLTPGAGPPPLIATLIEPAKRVGVPATLPAQDTPGGRCDHVYARGGLGEGFASRYVLSVHTRVAIRCRRWATSSMCWCSAA